MSDMPWELAISLRMGTVYKMQHRMLTSSLPHYVVVLNSSPKASDIIVLGVFSSQIEKTRQRRHLEPEETVVEIKMTEYEELTKHSIIDCNSPIVIDKNELIGKYTRKELVYCNDLNTEIVRKIIKGIQTSRHVPPKIKNILR